MKNKKRRVVLMSMLVMCIIMVYGACSAGKELAEEVILEVVKSELEDVLSDEEDIEEIELLDRVTDKDNKLDELFYKVITNDGAIEYEKYYSARYDLVDEEWIMDDIEEVDEDKWEMVPLKGVNENRVFSDITGELLMIEGEVWEITKENVSSLVVVNHETSLEKKKDSITVQFTINDVVEQAIGQVTVEYVFGSAWRKDSVKMGEFTVSTKPNFELKMSEENLIEELEKQKIKISDQKITIDEKEISNFEIKKHGTMYKGCVQNYEFICTLKKPHVEFELNVNATYEFRDVEGWVCSMAIETEVVTFDIVGEWKGTYTAAAIDGTMVLSIQELKADGTIKGVYSYTPDQIFKASQPGSYEISGWIDEETLEINLNPGKWIVKDTSAISGTKANIRAWLAVESHSIKGLGHEDNKFQAKRY